MIATNNSLNSGYINWKPIEVGDTDSPFTPCAPLDWLCRARDVAEESDECDITLEADLLATQELAAITPSNDELRKLAAKSPPPSEWFDGEEDCPL